MTLSTCTATPQPPNPLPHSHSGFYPSHCLFLGFLFTLTYHSLSFNIPGHPISPLPSFISTVSYPHPLTPKTYNPLSPVGQIRKGNLLNAGLLSREDERERHITKKTHGVLVGAVWVKDQNRPGTRKMFRLGQRACQDHQALAFDEDLLVQNLQVTWHSEVVSRIIVKNPFSLFIAVVSLVSCWTVLSGGRQMTSVRKWGIMSYCMIMQTTTFMHTR